MNWHIVQHIFLKSHLILLQIFLSWSLGVYWTIIVLSQSWGKMLIKWQKAKWFLEKSCILISSIITSICFVNKLESSKRLKIYIFFFFFFFHSWVRLCLECLEKKNKLLLLYWLHQINQSNEISNSWQISFSTTILLMDGCLQGIA